MSFSSFEVNSSFQGGAHFVTTLDAGAHAGGSVVVPGDSFLFDADYARLGSDLVLSGADGTEVMIQDYFAQLSPPVLVTASGARVLPDTVYALVGPLAPGQVAQLAAGAPGATPIGQVETAAGQVSVTRTDGTTVQMAAGDLVFQGDVVETGPDGALGIVFNDESSFALGESGRMVLDSYVYDPATAEGASATTVLKGVFTFISGNVASEDNNDMAIRTPVYSIGIRGTEGAVKGSAVGAVNAITLLKGGPIEVCTNFSCDYLTDAGDTATNSSPSDSPFVMTRLSAAEVARIFGSQVEVLYLDFLKLNDLHNEEPSLFDPQFQRSDVSGTGSRGDRLDLTETEKVEGASQPGTPGSTDAAVTAGLEPRTSVFEGVDPQPIDTPPALTSTTPLIVSSPLGLTPTSPLTTALPAITILGGNPIAGPTIIAGGFTNTGTINFAGSTLVANSGLTTINQGTFNLSGNLVLSGGTFVNDPSGSITGSGTLDATATNFQNNGTTGPGNSPGSIEILGDMILGATANTVLEVGDPSSPANSDHLSVSGTVTLDGTLTLSVLAGYVPQFGDSFQLFTWGALSPGSDFATVTGISAGNDALFLPSVWATGLTLDIVQNLAPTDITFAGAAIGELSGVGTVVGTASGVDANRFETLNYGLTDDAGGRFAIDANSGQITVAGPLDFETSFGSINVTVRVTDVGGLSYDEIVSLGVSDENEAPSAIVLSNATVAENDDGGVVGTLSVTDVDAGDSHSYIVDDVRFEVVAGQLKLKAGQVLDFETEASIDVTVTATDSGGLGTNRLFSLTVVDTNDAPTAIALSNNVIAENADGAAVGNLSVTDVDAGDSHTFAADDARFEIVAGQLKLKAGQTLDFETEPSVDVTVTATDLGGLGTNQLFTISVTGVNEAPTAIGLSNATVAENDDGGVVGNLTVTDVDAGDTHTFSVDDVRFEVVAGQLKLKAGQTLDFETEPSVDVTVTATDSGNLFTNQLFTLAVSGVNEAPTAISITNQSVDENLYGVDIGELTVTDPDAGASHTFATDDARFIVGPGIGTGTGNWLQLDPYASLDFEAGSTVNVTVTATDTGGLSYPQLFAITVNNLLETNYWTHVGTTDWADPDNWSMPIVPGVNEDVVIPHDDGSGGEGSVSTDVIHGSGSTTVNSLDADGYVNLTGGSLTIAGTTANPGSGATAFTGLRVSDTMDVGGTLNLSQAGKVVSGGTLRMTGGTLNGPAGLSVIGSFAWLSDASMLNVLVSFITDNRFSLGDRTYSIANATIDGTGGLRSTGDVGALVDINSTTLNLTDSTLSNRVVLGSIRLRREP